MNDDKKAAIVVLLLIILTIAAYPFTSLTDDKQEIYGIQSYSFFQEGNIYPLITAIFTHLDERHIFGNTVFLFVFGITLATFIGWKKFLVVYFIGGTVGNLAWVIYPVIDEGAASVTAVGASGAVFAAIAALAMAKPKNAADIAEKSEILKFFSYVPWLGLIYTLIMGEGILGFLGIIFYFLFVTIPDLILGVATAHAAHFGGMLAGLILGILFKFKGDFEGDENAKNKEGAGKKYEDIMPVHDYNDIVKT